MIVQFMTNPGGVVTDHTAAYLNFLRCVTAIATAAAGTSSLTIRPLTSNNAINSTQNCIVGIVANTEAGGWNVSTKHNVPGSPHLSNFNTAQTYTAVQSAADWLYVADFYNASTKSVTPYKKLSFHTWNDVGTWSNAWNEGASSSYTMRKAAVNSGFGTNIQVTFGASSSMDWTDTTYRPSAGETSYPSNVDAQTRSFTTGGTGVNGNASGGWNAGQALDYQQNSANKLFTMAVTADYCIIWETYYDGVGYGLYNGTAANPFSQTYGGGNTYWYASNHGFIVYAGLRTTQAWEDTANNNVPWVVFQCALSSSHGGGTGTYQPYSHNQTGALMLTMNNSNTLTQATPRVMSTTNTRSRDWWWSGRNSTVTDWAAAYGTAGNRLDGPLFTCRTMHSTTTAMGETGPNSNVLYKPQVDPVTGVMVPGAYPIVISRSRNNDWNAGGQIRGLYKSLSMPWANMKQYWLSPTQTFTVNGEQYLPFVINEDMWLVRYA